MAQLPPKQIQLLLLPLTRSMRTQRHLNLWTSQQKKTDDAPPECHKECITQVREQPSYFVIPSRHKTTHVPSRMNRQTHPERVLNARVPSSSTSQRQNSKIALIRLNVCLLLRMHCWNKLRHLSTHLCWAWITGRLHRSAAYRAHMQSCLSCKYKHVSFRTSSVNYL